MNTREPGKKFKPAPKSRERKKTGRPKKNGRPSVTDNDNIVKALIEVVRNIEVKYFYMISDVLLLSLINQRLKRFKVNVGISTWGMWKSQWVENRESDFFKSRPLLIEFFESYENKLIEAEEYLLDRLESSNPGHWQKYAWILERRFASWQLATNKQAAIVQVIQMTIAPPPDVPLITSERQMLSMYGDAEEIDHEEVDE